MLLRSLANTCWPHDVVSSQLKVDNAGLLELNPTIPQCCRWLVMSVSILKATKPLLKKFWFYRNKGFFRLEQDWTKWAHCVMFLDFWHQPLPPQPLSPDHPEAQSWSLDPGSPEKSSQFEVKRTLQMCHQILKHSLGWGVIYIYIYVCKYIKIYCLYKNYNIY